MPGGRARIGVILPAYIAGMEYDLWKMAPEGVTIHVTRIKPTKGCEPQDVEEFEKELKEAYFLLHEALHAGASNKPIGITSLARLPRRSPWH